MAGRCLVLSGTRTEADRAANNGVEAQLAQSATAQKHWHSVSSTRPDKGMQHASDLKRWADCMKHRVACRQAAGEGFDQTRHVPSWPRDPMQEARSGVH